jgi:hypothetical protein
MGTCTPSLPPGRLRLRSRQRSRRETRTIERRERSYQQRSVESGLTQSQTALAAFLFGLPPALDDGIADRPIAYFCLFPLAVGVETSDKRDMHGLLYRIFAALKFDGAKFGESPTLTMRQESLFLDTEAEEQATSKS